MPRYLYTCKRCDTRTIIVREIQHPEQIPTCLLCEKPQVRLYDFGSVSFKGDGFYSTENK
jgi:putative FmdB family regulatory protein